MVPLTVANAPMMPLLSAGALEKVIWLRGSTAAPSPAPEKLIAPAVRERPAKVRVEVPLAPACWMATVLSPPRRVSVPALSLKALLLASLL